MSDTVIGKIADLNQKNKVVFFIGAGLSAYAFPNSYQLASQIAAHLTEYKSEKTDNLMTISQKLIWESRGSRVILHDLLKATFDKTKIIPSKTHFLLAELCRNGGEIVTTNYDCLIENALSMSSVNHSVVFKDEQLPDKLQVNLLKTHGTIIEPMDCVITEDDYYMWGVHNPVLQDYLRYLFFSHHIVFIGYSLNDYHFRKLIQNIILGLANHACSCFLLVDGYDKKSYYYNYIVNNLKCTIVNVKPKYLLSHLLYKSYLNGLSDYPLNKYITSVEHQQDSDDDLTSVIITELMDGRFSFRTPSTRDVKIICDYGFSHSNNEYRYYRIEGNEYAYVPEGPFIMGGSRYGNDLVRTENIAEPFLISISQVSVRQYIHFLDSINECSSDRNVLKQIQDCIDNNTQFPQDYLINPLYSEYPIVCVSWLEADKFCRINKGHLPSERQWEKAARGIFGFTYSYGNTFNGDICVTDIKKRNYPAPNKRSNSNVSPYGCYDMCGNVYDWVNDNFSNDNIGNSKITKGGSFTRGKDRTKCSFRSGHEATSRWYTRSFKIVLQYKEGYEKYRIKSITNPDNK